MDFETTRRIKENLVDTWKRVDYHRIVASGEIVYSWCKEIDRRLTYTTDWQLLVQQIKPGGSVSELNGILQTFFGLYQGSG